MNKRKFTSSSLNHQELQKIISKQKKAKNKQDMVFRTQGCPSPENPRFRSLQQSNTISVRGKPTAENETVLAPQGFSRNSPTHRMTSTNYQTYQFQRSSISAAPSSQKDVTPEQVAHIVRNYILPMFQSKLKGISFGGSKQKFKSRVSL